MSESEDRDGPEDDQPMPLLEHLLELRRRLMYAALGFVVAFALCYWVSLDIYDVLMRPLARVMAEVGGTQRMIYTALTEGFFTQVKVAAFGAMFLSFPIVAAQLWMFVAPGLYKTERRAFLPFLVASPILFVMGAMLVYFMIIPMAWKFLLGFQTHGGETVLPIQLEARVGEYLSLIMTLIFAFGVSFQLPVLLTLLARAGLISSAALVSKRRYAIVLAFIIGAVLTPPDIISQIGLAVPLMLLYEGSIIACRRIERTRARAEAELDDDETVPPAP
jgi:sec-independent protein translocase protein TatC